MSIDSEDIATYATAAATIVGVIVVAPVMITKDIAVSIFSKLWESLTQPTPQEIIISNDNSPNQHLSENIDEGNWNVPTMGSSSS